MDELKIGDVVRLKSGGPYMTIQNIGDYTRFGHSAWCFWFDGNEKKDSYFALPTLAKQDDNKA